MANATVVRKALVYLPLPKQVEAIEAVDSGLYRWILYGGARGGAKSHFLRWLAYTKCLQYPGFQALLIRRTYPELEKSHMRRVPAEVKQLGGEFVPSAKPPIVRFRQGSILEFGHCQDAQDVQNFLSAEYNLFLPDETGTFEEDMVLKIASSVRFKSKDKNGKVFRPCIVGATNPGSLWIKDRWIDKVVDSERYSDYRPEEHFFIQSLLDDNPYPDEEYERMLNALDPATKAAWRDGRWDVFEGQYFKEFRRDLHVRHLDIPRDLPRIGGMDWGYANPGVHLWAVVLPDGHLHIEREYKFKETLADSVGQEITQTNRDYGLSLSVTYADPSMWIRSGQSGESIAETLQRAGVPCQRSNHERTNGWQRLRHWLRQTAGGTAGLSIDPDCQYLIRTLPALTHDKTHPEDVDTEGDDHAADALRYLVMGRPAPPFINTKPVLPKNSAGSLMAELVTANAADGKLGTNNVRFR